MPDQQPITSDPAAGRSPGPTPPTGEPTDGAPTTGATTEVPKVPATTGPTAPAPPSSSPTVAAETAAAQRTAGGSTEVDTVPPPPATPVYREGSFGVRGPGDTSGFGGLQRRVPVLPGATRPYGGYFDEIDAALGQAWPGYHDAVEKVVLDRGEMTLHVRREALVEFLRTLRDDGSLRFELLSSVSGVHYPDDPTGRPLHIVYHVTSMTYRRRIRLEVSVPDDDPHVPSVVAVYPGANWQERETYDLFGIVFDNHPALTRILMPDDWIGHPQRKDYPLGGIPVEYKGAEIPPPNERRSYQ